MKQLHELTLSLPIWTVTLPSVLASFSLGVTGDAQTPSLLSLITQVSSTAPLQLVAWCLS